VRASRFLLWLFGAATIGIAVFGVLVWRAVDVTEVTPDRAAAAFDAARAAAGDTAPLIIRDTANATLVRRTSTPPAEPTAITHIYVLSYSTGSGKLTRADVPFWFFRLKAPAAEFFVQGTGLDMSTLGLTAADLAREGPTLVLDETDTTGNRLLVWTE
jgi:hypothetical protein